jgi:hypothetical protein
MVVGGLFHHGIVTIRLFDSPPSFTHMDIRANILSTATFMESAILISLGIQLG